MFLSTALQRTQSTAARGATINAMNGLHIVIVVGLVAAFFFFFLRKMAADDDAADSTPAPKPPGPKLHWLVVTKGADEGKAFHIGSRRVVIGRDPNAFVQLSDPAASRAQCQVVPDKDGLKVLDMTSANGTFVNGKAVIEHVLQDGDVLGVADSTLIYRREADHAENAGFARKDAGRASRKTTAMMSGNEARAAAADALLAEHHGDRAAAAEAMGVSAADFDKLVDS